MNSQARRSSAAALIFGLMGCHASVNADAHVNAESASADGNAEVNGPPEGQGEMARSTAGATPDSSSASAGLVSSGPSARVLLGARHDLTLKQGSSTATCECLAVALGGSHSPGMVWSAVPPDIDEAAQLSLALSSEGQSCKNEPKNSLGASYWGYRISGNDVIVLVEAARGGHPLTSGAIIPKPVGPGQVYVAPTSKKLPYGRALSGQGLCKIGNPGQPRTSAFTELEIGSDAPPSRTGAVSRENAPPDAAEQAPTTIELPPN